MGEEPGELLVKTKAAAKTLGVCARTVRRWVRDGELPGRRLGRRYYVYRSALDALTLQPPQKAPPDDPPPIT